MSDIAVGCRVVCINDRFPEQAYTMCAVRPKAEGVYTVSHISLYSLNVVTGKPNPSIRVLELPQMRKDKPVPAWWAMWRFRRLDDGYMSELMGIAVPETVESDLVALGEPVNGLEHGTT